MQTRFLPTFTPQLVILGALVAVLVAILGPALPAIAQTRVVVENFRGPQAGRIRGHVVAALSDGGMELVARDEANAVARDLGLSPGRLGEAGYPQVAASLNVAAFVRGRVSRRRRRWSVTVTVINGADGAELGRASWGGRTVSALGAVRRSGYSRLEPFLSTAEAPAVEDSSDATETEGENAWWNSGNEEETPPGDGDEEEDSEPVDPGSRFDWLSFELLGGFLHRSMSASAVVLNNGRDPSMPDNAELSEIRSYTSAGLGHGELGFRLGFFPGAIPDDQPVPWFGAFLEFRHSVGLTSKGCPQTGPCNADADRIEVGTSQLELYVGAQGRFRFGDERGDPTIWADVGYGMFGFLLNTQDLQQLERPSVIPPVRYTYVHLGAGIDYALVPVYFTAGVRGAFRAGLGVGDDGLAIWGVNTGAPTGFEFAIDLKSEAPYIVEGAFFGLSFEYFAFRTTWRGQTACADPDNCVGTLGPWETWPFETDPVADPDIVTGGIADPVNDNYIRLYLTLGYAFR